MIYIKYLPKNKLLFELWKYARPSHYMYYCPEKIPSLTLEQATLDIYYMIKNNRPIKLTTYYGRLLHINLSNDYVNCDLYNLLNGRQYLAERIIQQIIYQELCLCYKKYYTLF